MGSGWNQRKLLKIIRMYSLISFMAIHKHNLPLFSRYRICFGFKLMPRIHNWKDLTLFSQPKIQNIKHIDTLFSDTIDWDIIEKHWQDMMQVVCLFIMVRWAHQITQKVKWTTVEKSFESKTFQELGYVIRTLFLLDYISDVELHWNHYGANE